MRLTSPSWSAYALIMGRCCTGYTAISGGMPGMTHSYQTQMGCLRLLRDTNPPLVMAASRLKCHQKKCAGFVVEGVRNVRSDDSSTLGCMTSFPREERRMMTVEFITALFYEVDEQLRTIPKHPEAHLWPSEVVTLGLLHALKGVGNRPFYRWLTRDYRPLFPHLPERTRLFRLLTTHQVWTQAFLAAPTVLGVIDTYGIELIHPIRDGRSPQQIGRKGLSNHRWIVGGTLCLLLNQWG